MTLHGSMLLVFIWLAAPAFGHQTMAQGLPGADNPVQRTMVNGEILLGEPTPSHPLPDRLPSEPLMVAIDTPYQIFANTGTLIHVAAWTPQGQPAAGAEVYLSGQSVGRMDENGTLVFRWGVRSADGEAWSGEGNVAVRWESEGNLHGGNVRFRAYPRTGSFASDHVFVYTDRGLYNPGDTLHLRTIAWHLASDFSPLADTDIEFLLTDPQGRVVAGGQAQTNAYGVTALDLPLSEQADEGIYQLLARYEDASTTARIRVERFTPPLIHIEHTLGRFLTRDQESLIFDVSLSYFTGGEFLGGRIAVDALIDGDSRYHQEIEVNGPGPHPFVIERSALDAIRRGMVEDELAEIRIEVTDSYGRCDDLTREMRFTRNPYIAIIERDRDAYRPGDPVELIIRLTDRDRVPVRHTEVTLLGSDESSRTATTDDRGTVQFSLTMPDREIQVQVLVADVGSALATARLALEGSTPMRSHIAQAIVRENQSVPITINFPSHIIPAESVVHLDVVDSSGSLVQAALLPITERDGRYFAEGSFVAPSWGSMLLTLFCLGSEDPSAVPSHPGESILGLITEGQNLAVHPDRELVIELDGIPDELAPGAEYSGRIRVSDAQGNPVDAAIGAAMVDMAVLSLKDPLEITPMDLFYNPRLRVLSTTGSAILTWPVVSRNWGQSRRDIALPPFPYRSGGTIFGALADKAKEGEISSEDEEHEEQDIGDYGWDRSEADAAQAAIITVRTDFPETSLWDPYIDGSSGSASVRGTVPDSITTQQLSLVASDRQGRVGMARVAIGVTQPLFVQLDLPDSMTVEDEVEVRVLVQNLGDDPLEVEVSLESDGLDVRGGSRDIELAAGATGVASFAVRARHAGQRTLVARATAGRRSDGEQRQIWVRPLGTPRVTVVTEPLTAQTPSLFEVLLPEDGQMSEIRLSLTFPAVTAAYAGLMEMRARMTGNDAFSTGGEIIASALLYEYQRSHGVEPGRLAERRTGLARGLSDILAAQRTDGGWGFFWDQASNPYITAYCVEALTALDRAGVYAPATAFAQASSYLASEVGTGLYDTAAIAFWEGDSNAVRQGITAEIFSILSDIPARGRTPQWRRLVEALAASHIQYLGSDTPDVLTYAHAVLGLYRSVRAGVVEMGEESLLDAARRLNGIRRGGYWEPSWFNAYGGTIEATVTALMVYRELGQEQMLAAEQREAVGYLMSTRDEWGAWHNPRGTAAAIRGLLAMDLAVEEGPSTVTVLVGGREIRRVAIDPEDPFLSALSLSSLDLTGFVEIGEENAVEVRYDGSLEATASVTIRHWGETRTQAARSLRLESSVSAASAAPGDLVHYLLRVHSDRGAARLIQVDLAAPSNARIDERSLAALVDRGLIQGFTSTPGGYRLILELAGQSGRELDILMETTREGEALVPAAVAASLCGPGGGTQSLAVAVLDRPLVVR